MGRKTQYTHITPLPPGIPRQLAIDMLHSHGEIIELNPLVLEHRPIEAPKNAAADEYFAAWYEITERIQYIPGMGKMGSGKISFKGVFHDMPWGLQTHVYAPAGINMRNKWQIKGNQPGEPREPRELGDKAPIDGLYLQEDIEIVANAALIPFVKKGMKAASAVLVERLLKKAQLLDAGQLQAMIENGRLKTVNPVVANQFAAPGDQQLPSQMVLGPGQTPYSPRSPPMPSPHQSFRDTYYNPNPNPNQYPDPSPRASAYVRQSSYGQPQQNAIEMPGSYYHPQPPQQNPAYLQSSNNRYSTMSELSASSPRQASFSDSHSPPMGGHSPRPGGAGSVHDGSEYSSTTATSELPSQPVGGGGGYLRTIGSPGLTNNRYSVMSEMPTSKDQ